MKITPVIGSVNYEVYSMWWRKARVDVKPLRKINIANEKREIKKKLTKY